MAEAGSNQAAEARLDTLEQLKLLADDTRWRLLQLLRRSDCLVTELVELTGLAQNLVSYHLTLLRQAGLVQVHRSDADARASYYGVNLAALAALYRQLGADLALPGLVDATSLPPATVITPSLSGTATSTRGSSSEPMPSTVIHTGV